MYRVDIIKMDKITDTQYTGQVKWFDKQRGIGFITVVGDSPFKVDIFVHNSRIMADGFRYLVTGEYVEFTVIASTNDKFEYESTYVTGIKGGKLMCQVRAENADHKS